MNVVFKHFLLILMFIPHFGHTIAVDSSVLDFCAHHLQTLNNSLASYNESLRSADIAKIRRLRKQNSSFLKSFINGLEQKLKHPDVEMDREQFDLLATLSKDLGSSRNPELQRLGVQLKSILGQVKIAAPQVVEKRSLELPSSVLFVNHFKKQFDRLLPQDRARFIEQVVPGLLSGQIHGEGKASWSSKIKIAKFRSTQGTDLRVGFVREGAQVKLIMIGTREDFYEENLDFVKAHYGSRDSESGRHRERFQ